MIFDYKFVIVAILFIILDVVTGLVSSWVTGTYKSSIMREGGKHKLMLLVAIIFGIALDYAQGLVDLGFSIPATSAISIYIALMEILSCLENINKGFPNALPKVIKSMISNAAKEAGIEVNNSEGNNLPKTE